MTATRFDTTSQIIVLPIYTIDDRLVAENNSRMIGEVPPNASLDTVKFVSKKIFFMDLVTGLMD